MVLYLRLGYHVIHLNKPLILVLTGCLVQDVIYRLIGIRFECFRYSEDAIFF